LPSLSERPPDQEPPEELWSACGEIGG
jgi:hypothetical protein